MDCFLIVEQRFTSELNWFNGELDYSKNFLAHNNKEELWDFAKKYYGGLVGDSFDRMTVCEPDYSIKLQRNQREELPFRILEVKVMDITTIDQLRKLP